MAKDDKPPEPKPWSPDQPLEDADVEAECQDRARAKARLDYLTDQYKTPPKPDKGKRKYKLFES